MQIVISLQLRPPLIMTFLHSYYNRLQFKLSDGSLNGRKSVCECCVFDLALISELVDSGTQWVVPHLSPFDVARFVLFRIWRPAIYLLESRVQNK